MDSYIQIIGSFISQGGFSLLLPFAFGYALCEAFGTLLIFVKR